MIESRFGNQLIIGFTKDDVAALDEQPHFLDMNKLKAPDEKDYWAPAAITFLYADTEPELERMINDLHQMLKDMHERLKREMYGGHSPN